MSGAEQSNPPSSHRSFLELPITHFETEWNGEWSRRVAREGTVRDLLNTWDIDDPDERAEIAQVLRHLRDAKAIAADEIDRLRAELAAMREQRDEAVQLYTDLLRLLSGAASSAPPRTAFMSGDATQKEGGGA